MFTNVYKASFNAGGGGDKSLELALNDSEYFEIFVSNPRSTYRWSGSQFIYDASRSLYTNTNQFYSFTVELNDQFASFKTATILTNLITYYTPIYVYLLQSKQKPSADNISAYINLTSSSRSFTRYAYDVTALDAITLESKTCSSTSVELNMNISLVKPYTLYHYIIFAVEIPQPYPAILSAPLLVVSA